MASKLDSNFLIDMHATLQLSILEIALSLSLPLLDLLTTNDYVNLLCDGAMNASL